jgi:hypothetical protein
MVRSNHLLDSLTRHDSRGDGSAYFKQACDALPNGLTPHLRRQRLHRY